MPSQYRLYVVELGTYPSRDSRVAVYVGSTSLSPEERFAKHMSGAFTAADKAHKYGTRLLPDLYADSGIFTTRAVAEREEKALAKSLKRAGYKVFGGSGRPMPTRARIAAGGASVAKSRKSKFTGNLKTTQGGAIGVRVAKKASESVEVWIVPVGPDGKLPKLQLSQSEALRVAAWLLNAAVALSDPPTKGAAPTT